MKAGRSFNQNESSYFSRGYGTRISEESHLKPKPMIEIGILLKNGLPIIIYIIVM